MRQLFIIALLATRGGASDVTVFTNGDTVFPNATNYRAKAEVSQMYARIGVRLSWTRKTPAGNDAGAAVKPIRAVFLARTPDSIHPGVLAFSQPFDPIPTITVLCDRIQSMTERRPAIGTSLLAHVLAHEIGHVLSGSTAHADFGLMKAQWGEADYLDMEKRALPFPPLAMTWIAARLNIDRCRSEADEAAEVKSQAQQTPVTIRKRSNK